MFHFIVYLVWFFFMVNYVAVMFLSLKTIERWFWSSATVCQLIMYHSEMLHFSLQLNLNAMFSVYSSSLLFSSVCIALAHVEIGEDEWCGHPGQFKGQQNGYFKCQNLILCIQKNFKLLIQVKINSMHTCVHVCVCVF